jgi:hypothetical protein
LILKWQRITDKLKSKLDDHAITEAVAIPLTHKAGAPNFPSIRI